MAICDYFDDELCQKIKKLQKDQYSLMEISNLLERKNSSYSWLYSFCKRNGIETKKCCFSRTSRKYKDSVCPIPNKDDLRDLYVKCNMSMKKIGEIYGVTSATVLFYLRKYKIPRKLSSGKFERQKPKVAKKILESLYYEQLMSLHEIAKHIGVPNGARVQTMFDYYQIERRNYKQAAKAYFERFPEQKDIKAQYLLKREFLNKVTWIELAFMEWCDKIMIDYQYQFQFDNGNHRYDFLIRNTCILVEVDGLFWHSTPEAKYRDSLFDAQAYSRGFDVVRFTDEQIKSYGDKIFEEKLYDRIKHVIRQ